jgi:hypothetical protein
MQPKAVLPVLLTSFAAVSCLMFCVCRCAERFAVKVALPLALIAFDEDVHIT